MFQIYLLTVLANGLAGFLIADSFFREKNELCGPLLDLFTPPNTRLGTGLVILIIGIVSLFKFTPADIVFLGDLLPSLGALIGGLIIGSQALSEKMEEAPQAIKFITGTGEKLSAPLGLAILAAGLLHAIIPTAVIL